MESKTNLIGPLPVLLNVETVLLSGCLSNVYFTFYACWACTITISMISKIYELMGLTFLCVSGQPGDARLGHGTRFALGQQTQRQSAVSGGDGRNGSHSPRLEHDAGSTERTIYGEPTRHFQQTLNVDPMLL